MRDLAQVFDSLVKSFDNRETANFIDLRDLERHIGDTDLFESIVTDYNENRATSYFTLKQLEILVLK
jgi:hypothetical protein